MLPRKKKKNTEKKHTRSQILLYDVIFELRLNILAAKICTSYRSITQNMNGLDFDL